MPLSTNHLPSARPDGPTRGRSTSTLGVAAMSRDTVSYEPVFGGIVSVLATALLYFVLFEPSPHSSHVGTAFLAIISGRGIFWGIVQIVGYRKAIRDNVKLSPPLLGTALSCVLFGLIFAAITVLLYELAPNQMGYTIAIGIVAVALLAIGAVVGIREGVWR